MYYRGDPKGLYVLVSIFWFIWIPVLWFYTDYKYFNSYSAGIDFRRQNLTSTDVRFRRLKSISALKGLIDNFYWYTNLFYLHETVDYWCFPSLEMLWLLNGDA